MADEPEWQGFALFTEPWVREALYAAGVDCAVPASPEPDAIVQFLECPRYAQPIH